MLIILLVVVGLALGSFVNAFVWRWREQGMAGSRKKPKMVAKDSHNDDYSILSGRSMCPDCRRKLAVVDLLPVLSWLWLRGKCRYCKKPISAQYPLVELSLAAFFVVSYVYWPAALSGAAIAIFVLWLALLVGLAILAVYDLRWQLLPDKIVFSLLAIAAVQAIISIASAPRPFTALVNVVLGAAVGGGVFYLLYQLSGGRWIGGGDVKLGMVLGLIVATPGRAFLVLFLASLLGTLASLPLLLGGRLKRSSQIPFGPFLILAAIIVVLFGHDIAQWYQTAFLPSQR